MIALAVLVVFSSLAALVLSALKVMTIAGRLPIYADPWYAAITTALWILIPLLVLAVVAFYNNKPKRGKGDHVACPGCHQSLVNRKTWGRGLKSLRIDCPSCHVPLRASGGTWRMLALLVGMALVVMDLFMWVDFASSYPQSDFHAFGFLVVEAIVLIPYWNFVYRYADYVPASR